MQITDENRSRVSAGWAEGRHVALLWAPGVPRSCLPTLPSSEHAGNCREVRTGFSLWAPGLHLWQTGMDGCPDRELMPAVFWQSWPQAKGLWDSSGGAGPAPATLVMEELNGNAKYVL